MPLIAFDELHKSADAACSRVPVAVAAAADGTVLEAVAVAAARRDEGGTMYQERHTRLFTAIAVGLAAAIMAPIGSAKTPLHGKVTIPEWVKGIETDP